MIKFLFIALAILSLSVKGTDLKYFQYYKDANAKTTSPRAISAITLDNEVYSKTLNLYSDLRIIGENDQEIPFALRQVFLKNTYKYQSVFPSSIESLKKFNNTVVITVKQKKNIRAIDSISLKTPSKNFEKSVSIAVSNDNKLWNIIVANKAIFDYSSIIALRKVTIEIPRSKYKYFRITINNFSEEKTSPIHRLVKEKQSGISLKEITSVIKRKTHLKIDAVNLISISKSKTNASMQKQNYPIIISNIITKNKKTIIELHGASVPLTEMRLSSSSTNFSRKFSLQGTNENRKWHLIANRNWTKSNIFNKSADSGIITFSEARHKSYRITIQNGDNPPLKELKVSARGNIYRLVMLGKQALQLKLYYGAYIPPPQYEIDKLLPSVMDFDEINYKLSNEKRNPLFCLYRQKPNSYKWLFTVSIVVISLILVFILYKNFGKLNIIEDSDINPE